jgi:PAS domain S-box-containing protein
VQEKLEELLIAISNPEKKTVALSLGPRLFVLNGAWDWDMHSNAVYCSDVMSFPAGFEGTAGIIHPDDQAHVAEAMEELQELAIPRLHFRLITTYGEVKNISGKGVSIEKTAADADSAFGDKALRDALQEVAAQKELLFLRLRSNLADAGEKLEASGSWYTNKATGEYWYSDGFFRLHGVPPQSLNTHANTFSSFIHPDDSVAVLEALEQAYAAEAPLHIEYRIVRPGGHIRFVRHIMSWSFDERGECILSGTIFNHTDLQVLKNELKKAEDDAKLLQQVAQFVEKQTSSGYWIMNVVTRKASFSENFLRIHGIKPPYIASHKTFIKLVHPDEKETVLAAMERMYAENVLPEIEYRIIRPDGKQRYLRLSGKAFVHNKTEMMLVGAVHDITVQKSLQVSIEELNATLALQGGIAEITEQAAGVSSVVWLASGQMQWSDGFYKLLGYKPNTIEPVQRLWQKGVHTDDVKPLNDAILLARNGQTVGDLQFRMVSKAGMRNFRLHFQNANGEGPGTLIGIVQDVTARVALERRAAGRERYAALLEVASKDVLLHTNTENIIIGWSAAAEDKTGIRSEDARHKNIFDVFPNLREEAYLSQLHGAMAGREVGIPKAKNAYLAKAHSYQLVPFKDEHGVVQGVLHIIKDISRELEMQQQLSERLHFIENLLNATVDRIVVLDQHMNYLYWNPKAEEYYSINKHRVLGKNILEVFPAFRNDPSYQEFRRALKGETVHLPATALENSTAYFETYLIPIKDDDGRVNAVLWMVHDLSKELQLQQEREQNMALLHEEHRRMADAQAIGRIGSFEWNMGSDTVQWSDELYRIIGWEPQSREITVELTEKMVHPDDLAALIPLKQQSFEQPGFYQVTHRIIRPDGQTIYVAHRFESMADGTGAIVRVHGTVQDITDQVAAGQQAAENSALLRQTEEVGQIGSWEYDIASGKFKWSDAMYGLFGKAPAEEVHPEIYLQYATEAHKLKARQLVRFLKKEHTPFEETIHILVGGTEKILRIKASVIHDDKGRPQKMIGVDLDITNIREAEAKLEESQNILQQTTLASPDAIVILNLEQKSISYLNNVLSEWSGYTNRELADRGFEGRLQLVHPNDREQFAAFNEALLSATDDEVKQLDYRLQGINNLYWIRNRSRVFRRNKEGMPTHLLSILQNITDAYMAQEELSKLNASLEQKNKELQIKNDEITSFAFIASHDLKEPIRKIHTFTDILLHKESTDLSESSRSLLLRMNESVKHLNLLIRDIQELSRIHSETTGFENTSLNEAVQKAMNELAGEIAETGAAIDVGNLPAVRAIGTQTVYLFKNLLSNAIKFQPPGNKPQVIIRAETVPAAAVSVQHAAGHYLKVTVQDNGIGFDNEYKDKVFRIFQRLHGKEAFSGTGMGLSICRKVMENHQGFISVDSHVGRGTTFCCYFPM